jgi:cytochrome d ubiquinol oxidase subunit I
LVLGNEAHGIMSNKEKIVRGYEAQQTLIEYKKALKADPLKAQELRAKFNDPVWMDQTFRYFGYGVYYNDDPAVMHANAFKTVPPVSLTFYAFHIMVGLGMHFLLLFVVVLWLVYKEKLNNNRWVLWTAVWTIPLAYIASQSGWIVAEVGRQPWVIQDLMTTMSAVSNIDSTSVMITFFLFVVVFAALVFAEFRIMFKQIKKGPNKHFRI